MKLGGESPMLTQSGAPLDPQKLLQAMSLFCEDIILVSIWEDHFEPIAVNQLPVAESGGYYSAMAAQFVDEFIEPEYQANIIYSLSNEYICSHLSTEEPRLHVDFRHMEDGLPVYYRVHIVLVDVGAEGLVEHVLFAIQDITSRAREQDLEETAFSMLCRDYSQISFVDLNRDSMIVLHASPDECVKRDSMLSYRDAMEKIVNESILPQHQARVSAILSPSHLRNMLDSGVPRVEMSFERRMGGRRTWAKAMVFPLNEYTPQDARVMCFLRNISSERAREETYINAVLQDNAALSRALSSERQYRLALMADSYFYFICDVSGEGIISESYLSRGGTDIIREATGKGTPVPFELFYQKWYEIYQPAFARETSEEVFTLAYLRGAFVRNERIIDIEVQQTPPEGSNAPEFIEMYIVLSEDELTGHIMACVIWKDISEFRGIELQARIALKEAYEVAEQASRAKSEFLSRISHDIRTPMNAIIGMTAIARAHIDSAERVEDCLEKIDVSSKHLLSLINEVLDMSKIESGKLDLNEEPFALSDLIDDLSLMVRPQITAKHHEFNIHINNVRHEKVVGDSLRIQQIFVNFMSNAVKYTPEHGKIDLIITERPCRQHQFGCYDFIFQDNGIGMSSEFAGHIFEPFSRAEDTRVNKIQGTGLGMAIANNLVRMMNGSISVDSELGRGSKFTVTIFLRLQEVEEEDCTQFQGLPVLIVDDDPATCAATCALLEDMGMKGECLQDGQQAIERAVERDRAGEGFFAVILEWDMPKLNAPQVIRRLRRELGCKTPLVVVSAYDWSDIELDARSAGADGFISKPLFKSRLVHLFKSLMNGGENTTAPVQELGSQYFHGRRILLVEDNALNAEIATEILSMAGLSVEHAENGQRAVEMVQYSEPGWYDLIFMDVQMPVMNGYEATQAIRALDREDARTVPIVAMTANAFTEDVEAAMRSGMNAHIAKPLDFDQLNKLLSKYLT